MRNYTVLFVLILFSSAVFAQKPVQKPSNSGSALDSSAANASGVGERVEFEKAVALGDAAQRIKALQKFTARFPKSTEKGRALELIASARAQSADEKLRAGDAPGGVALFKLAVKDAPAPVSDRLFADVILRIPTNLFFRGERDAATQIAVAIEAKIDGNAKQLLALATYYLGVENAEQAKRLAEKALAVDANLPAAYQTLGLANRLNFDLENAAASYQKALELDANSIVSKRSLAEMKRALGKADEAIILYREILDKNAADALASSGLILSLFDAGKKQEAETELQKSLALNPNNLTLLVGAAFAYTAQNDAPRAVELAEKAVAVEPRYIWSYLALARGYLKQNRFYDAERALLAARAYGNFPTLEYELASVRAAAGFYREAARGLAKSFTVKDDSVSVKLGGRIEKQAKSFTELVAFERRASIFEPLAADDADNSERLKSLLDFYQKLESPNAASDAEIADAADKFVDGGKDNRMKLHRRLFAANRLLDGKKALAKVPELMKTAAGEVDAALDVPNASSAVLADELFESRAAAIAANRLVVVPEVERKTLSNVLRGRIEEISGAALLEDGKTTDAILRLKRAIGILPEKSAWWRSSQWRLGAALEADGKSSDALAAYIKSYASETVFNPARRAVIESLYKKVNGSLDGLDAKIGAKPVSNETAAVDVSPKTVAASPSIVETKSTPDANAKSDETANAAPVEKQAKSAAPPEISSAESNAKTKPNAKQTKTRRTRQPEISKTAPPEKSEERNVEKPASALFEPIIITVPKVEDRTGAAKKTVGDSADDASRAAAENGKTGQTKCELTFSQPSVSLASGGNLEILVRLEGDGDAREIRAASSSGGDVEVVFEPQNGAASGGAYFVVKSVSAKTGAFTVTFEAPCGGRKEIVVNVR